MPSGLGKVVNDVGKTVGEGVCQPKKPGARTELVDPVVLELSYIY